MMITRDWHGCYARDWNGTLHPDAYVHPAKVAYGLAERIYNHCLAQGYFRPGDTVLDPFFGVGGFAFHALLNGLNVVGVELEPNFVELARKNLDLWRGKYGPGVAVLDDLRARGKLAPYGAAVAILGDSRQLRQVVAGAQGAVSSPPFSPVGSQMIGQHQGVRGYYQETGRQPEQQFSPSNLGNLPPGDFASVIGSPPYADSLEKSGGIDPDKSKYIGGPHSQMNNSDTRYGTTPGQLGAMHAVGPPPFADSLNSDDPDRRGGLFHDPRRRNDRTLTAEYGESEGQLGRMHAVGSPPFESNNACNDPKYQTGRTNGGGPLHSDYGDTAGQLGQSTGDSFWEAASLIMSEVAAILPPGAFAVWVCKRFVRDGAIVEFSQQWAALGEHHGFETVEWIRAWLVEEQAEQMTLDGGVKRKSKERKSFFRRLAESKGSPRIDWEDVIIQVRKGATP